MLLILKYFTRETSIKGNFFILTDLMDQYLPNKTLQFDRPRSYLLPYGIEGYRDQLDDIMEQNTYKMLAIFGITR